VRGEGGENLSFFWLRHVEVIERSRKLSRDLVEDLRRDL
jgi:hypothetical protein